jgi:hypothetical protein
MSTINVGDLVVVIARHLGRCGCPNANIGKVGTVSDVRTSRTGFLRCGYCNDRVYYPGLVAVIPDIDKNIVFELGRLKKIPPLEREDARTEARMLAQEER